MEDRTILITGAGSGIGHAVALLCAELGARVAALDLDAARAEAVAREAQDGGAAVEIGLNCDVGDEAEVEQALDLCRAELGIPYGVFANAGIEMNAPSHELPYEIWNRVLTTNLGGVFLTCKHALRHMVDEGRGGAIVCTSSPAAFVGFSGGGNGAYAASKGGISALVRSLALDYASHGIRVNAVVPGATDTPLMFADTSEEGETSRVRTEVEAKVRREIPLGRLADPEEIARAVVWLLSDEASYVTGSHLVCDGGILAKSSNTI